MLNKFSFFLVLVVSLLILFQINSNKSKALEYLIASNHGHRSLACSAGGQGHLRRRRWALLARRLMRLSAIGGWGLGLAAAASDGGRRKKERG